MSRASEGKTDLTTSWETIFEAGQGNDGQSPFSILLTHISSTSGIDIRVTPTHVNMQQDGATPDSVKLDSNLGNLEVLEPNGITKVEAKLDASGAHELRWAVTGGGG
jgi:hypothetical protein